VAKSWGGQHAHLRVIPVDDSGQVLPDEYRKLLQDRTKLEEAPAASPTPWAWAPRSTTSNRSASRASCATRTSYNTFDEIDRLVTAVRERPWARRAGGSLPPHRDEAIPICKQRNERSAAQTTWFCAKDN
jgi:hypothetical protein